MQISDYLIMSDEKWHVEKTINIGHILTTIVMASSALWFFSDMKQAINANTQSIEFIQDRHVVDMNRLDSQREEDLRRVEKRLDKIDAKLDRILEGNKQ